VLNFIIVLITLAALISLGIKWEIKLKIVIPWAALMAFLAFVTFYCINRAYPSLPIILLVSISILQAFVITGGCVLISFYRDPERIPPNADRAILSPADGRVIYIKNIRKGEFPLAAKGKKDIPLEEFTSEKFIVDRGIQIGIAMNFLHVHINRTPIKGKIEQLTFVPGKFHSLKRLSSLLENERVFTIIAGTEIKIGVVQIASRLVRRIVSFVSIGDSVEFGQKMGVIRFGSQVDVLIPFKEGIKILVEPKQEIKAGISIIASY